MTIMTSSAELKSYPWYPGQGRNSSACVTADWADQNQGCHPGMSSWSVDVNNEEVNPPELIINDRSVPVLLLLLTHPVLVLTMIQDSDNYFAVNISQPCIWWPEPAWSTRDLGSYKLTDPWLNIWIQTWHMTLCIVMTKTYKQPDKKPALATH